MLCQVMILKRHRLHDKDGRLGAKKISFPVDVSGQMKMTDLPQMVVKCKGIFRLFQGNLGW